MTLRDNSTTRQTSMTANANVFLTAEWRDLLLLNYEVEPEFVRRSVPRGTELDSFRGKTYVSLVGFRFLATRLSGKLAIPFHTDFTEINLRFYVRREVQGEIRRGVVFIAEIVPRLAIATAARVLYNENYVCRKMKHETSRETKSLQYSWKEVERWCSLQADFAGQPALPEEGSLQQFLIEHYWGYTSRKDAGSTEYRVEHVPWKIWPCMKVNFVGDPSNLYGHEFAEILRKPPDSVIIAEGSAVSVYNGTKIA